MRPWRSAGHLPQHRFGLRIAAHRQHQLAAPALETERQRHAVRRILRLDHDIERQALLARIADHGRSRFQPARFQRAQGGCGNRGGRKEKQAQQRQQFQHGRDSHQGRVLILQSKPEKYFHKEKVATFLKKGRKKSRRFGRLRIVLTVTASTVYCLALAAWSSARAVTNAGRISLGTAFILSSATCTSGRITTYLVIRAFARA